MSDNVGKRYMSKRRKLSGVFFETALPNEYLVEVGRRTIKPVLGGRRFRLFRKILRVPGSVETLYFQTDNANMNYQGIGVEGYASWRIDPARPEIAIATLDFFDDDDPMRDTNAKLTTICVEAVRHVIANMSIDDALKKKDEIGDNLKTQLKKFEQRWGILFDQVGIKKVSIMSERLFEDLQSEFRDKLRLDVSKTRIQTDREIAGAENEMRELTETERMETERKLSLADADGKSEVNSDRLTKDQSLFEQERVINEDRFRKEADFRIEQNERDYSAQMKEQELKSQLQELERDVLQSESELEEIRSLISSHLLDIRERERIIDETHTPEQMTREFIQALPALYSSLDIDNYSVMDTGSAGVTPVTRILQEAIGLMKGNGLEGILNRVSGNEPAKKKKPGSSDDFPFDLETLEPAD